MRILEDSENDFEPRFKHDPEPRFKAANRRGPFLELGAANEQGPEGIALRAR